MLKKYTESINANIYISAAKELGVKVEILDKTSGFARFVFKEREIRLLENILSVNDAVGVDIASQKCIASSVLRSVLGEVIPDFITVNLDKSYQKAVREFFKKHEGRIVVKPNTGSLARGVLVLPSTIEEVFCHLEEVSKNRSAHFILERYSAAKREFRVIVVRGEIIDVIERVAANVIGDGESTLGQSIKKKDALKKKHQLPVIRPNEKFLRSQGLDMGSVIDEGQLVKLNRVCNMGMGGDVKVFDLEGLHPVWHEVAQKISEVTELNLVGIDVMSDDLSKDPYSGEVETIINEINSAPMPELQYFARSLGGSAGRSHSQDDPLSTVKELLRRFLG
jgi:glutamate--cysteine ligase